MTDKLAASMHDIALGRPRSGAAVTTQPEFLDDQHLRVNGVDFHCSYQWNGNDDMAPEGFLPVAKLRDQVERYLRLQQDMRAEVIVELGIDRGGSIVGVYQSVRAGECHPPALRLQPGRPRGPGGNHGSRAGRSTAGSRHR